MSSPLTIAIIGAGSRGLHSYGRYIAEHPDEAKVVAVAEPREWQREQASKIHSIETRNCFSGWRELAARDRLAEVAIVATPDAEHIEPVLALIDRGYDILLEKPMARSEADCRTIVSAAKRKGIMLAVCHVLRYTPYFRKLKEIIASGVLGQIASVRHLEQVGFWHQAHSYVRGNWRNAREATPMILAKSCHDFDILLYLLDSACLRLSSFGSLSHFKASNKPAGAAGRCLDCPLADGQCPYSAKTFYLQKLKDGATGWPLCAVTDDLSEAGIQKALRAGPYGKCVYDCDNDVVDHQVVAMEFDGGISVTFTMTAFTADSVRQIDIFGSAGELRGNGHTIEVTDFRTQKKEIYNPHEGLAVSYEGHFGGDDLLMRDFISAVRNKKASAIQSGPEISLMSHLMAFAAERARVNGTVETIRI